MALHAVINYIWIDKNEITVGVTDSERWQWDTQDGMSGADARTMVFATITDNGKGYVSSENVGFFCARTEKDLRSLALSVVGELLDIAWDIKEQHLTHKQANEKYFGRTL